MERRTLEWFDLLGRALLWAAAIVLLLSLIGAIAVATSDSSSIPFAEDVQRQGRGIFAIVSIGGGIAAAGVLSGLGAIVSMMVADRKVALPGEASADGPVPEPPEGGTPP